MVRRLVYYIMLTAVMAVVVRVLFVTLSYDLQLTGADYMEKVINKLRSGTH